jgi:transposase InsO family protein
VFPLHFVAAMLCGWLQREQADVIAFLREENRVLKARLEGHCLRLTDDERRRLATLGHRVGRRLLAQVATLVTPDTILRWHRELVAQKWTYGGGRGSRAGLQARIRALVVRMATENPTWGYTRIQGALKNLGHQVGRSTIARILKAAGIPPSRQRPMAWRTFVRAHWPALVAADFFTTEVWTVRGLVTYYTAFVIELHSRRVRVLGSTPHPDEAFVLQTLRGLTGSVDDVLRDGRILICDRDPKWSRRMEDLLATAGVRVFRTPAAAPNCNAHAERFVRSIKEECLNRIVPLGERHLRRLLREFVEHYHGERNHQGLGNELIDRPPIQRTTGPVRRRQRAGGILGYYYRSAA